VSYSDDSAIEVYQKAADHGSADAQNNLGLCYELGRGVKQSYTRAADLYQKSAEHGMHENYVKAIKSYQEAANQGDTESKKSLEFLLDNVENITIQ